MEKVSTTTEHAGDVWIAYNDEQFTEEARTVETALDFGNERTPNEVLLRSATGAATWWGVAMRRERGIYPKCVDCDEGRGTCPQGRCRDCDIAACAS